MRTELAETRFPGFSKKSGAHRISSEEPDSECRDANE
jgi:hypothetical protein